MLYLLVFLTILSTTRAITLCDDQTGPNCNPFSSYDFSNQESVAIPYPIASPTTVNGITYDVVIQWTHQIGEVIEFSWEVYPDNKRDRFDCTTSKMWFDGIEVGATTYFRGRKNDEPYCIFDMQTGTLSNAYLQNPAQTVYFLFDNTMDDGTLMFIDKNRDLPIVPSDDYDPTQFDPTIVCTDPNGLLCNPISTITFDTTTIQFDYQTPGDTDVINDGTFDVVIQWVPPLDSSVDSSWKVYPSRTQDPFACDSSRLWLNGTIVSATNGFDGDIPNCIFDIHDGIMQQRYIDKPGRTVFFLFSNLVGVSDTIFITKDFSKPIIASEDYNPDLDSPSIICDDPSPQTCNVIDTVSFVGTDTNLLTFTSPGSTIIDGVNFDMVIKLIVDIDSDIEFSWKITPVRRQDPFDCSTTKIWINGTTFDTVSSLNGAGNSYCYFNISNGILPQEIIDNPENKVFFLLKSPLLGVDDEFTLAVDYEFPVVSFENYDPVLSNPSIVCDDPNGPNCNVIDDISFINVYPVTIDYSTIGLTTVNGTDYNSVVKWNVDPATTITHSWEIYPDRRQDLTSCDGVNMWFDGTVIGSTLYFRGAQNNEPYCVVDMQNGKLTDAILQYPYNKVFFLFDSPMPLGATYYIAKNYDLPIISRENLVFYLYDRVGTTAVTDANLGTTFTVTVENLTYPDFPEFNGIGSCNTMNTVMSSILIADCAVDVETSDSVGGIYTYFLPKELYYLCSYQNSLVQKDIQFTTMLLFKEGTPSCKYFSPLVSSQSVIIEVLESSMVGISDIDKDGAEYEIVNSTIELCNPLLFPLPQIISIVTVNVTFLGDSIEVFGLPYLDTLDNVLDIHSKTCTVAPNPSIANFCVYELKSSICRPIFSLDGGGCGVDRFFPHVIHDFKIKETIDASTGASFVVDYGPIPTSIGIREFSGEICSMYDDFVSFNINDQYNSIIKIRNRPNPQWNDSLSVLSFFEPLIVELSLEDGGNGTTTQLEISNVEVVVRDGDTDEILNKYYFNRGNKMALMYYSWSPYYKDVHFCSSNCGNFYDNYTTPYVTDIIIPQLNDICQLSVDISSKDYFSFVPHNWFDGLSNPTLKLEFNLVAIIKTCETHDDGMSDEIADKFHVTTGATVKMSTPYNNEIPGIVVTGSFGGALEKTKDITSILFAALITVTIIATIAIYFNMKQTRKDDYEGIQF